MLDDDEDRLDDDNEHPAAYVALRPIDKFRGTAVGGVFAAGMLGLRDVLEPRKDDEIAIVQDWGGEPPFEDAIVLRLDPEHPEDSIVMVRPWKRARPSENLDG